MKESNSIYVQYLNIRYMIIRIYNNLPDHPTDDCPFTDNKDVQNLHCDACRQPKHFRFVITFEMVHPEQKPETSSAKRKARRP